MKSEWECRICKKKYLTIAHMTRHMFLDHKNEVIGVLPYECFNKIGDLFIKEFLELWKLAIKKRK